MRTTTAKTAAIFLCGLIYLSLTFPAPAQAAVTGSGYGAVGAPNPDSGTSVTVYVNNQHANASDNNTSNNSSNYPLKTIQRGVEHAYSKARNGQSVTILVSPGTYRGGVSLYGNNSGSALVVLKATSAGAVTVKGSDQWTGWTRHSGNIFKKTWNYDWGKVPTPSGWPTVPEISARKELVFVNGQNMNQKLSLSGLPTGSFYVDQGANLLYVNAPSGISDLNSATVEVGVRDSVLSISRSNVVVNGIKFMHATGSIITGQAAWVGNVNKVSFKNVEISNNGGCGLGMTVVKNSYFQNLKASYNGGTGNGGTKFHTVLFEDLETNYNNWRGNRGGFVDWSIAGTKHFYAENTTYRRYKSERNYAYGFWCDTACIDVRIEDSKFLNNLKAGLYFEAMPGPMNVMRSQSANNEGQGILARSADNLTFTDSVLYGNKRQQILMTGSESGRGAKSWTTGQQYTTHFKNWQIHRNFIQGKYSSGDGKWLISSSFGQSYWTNQIKAQFNANDNTWYNGTQSGSFNTWIGQTKDFNGWKSATGNDSRSKWQNPGFRNPDNNDFSR